MAITVDDLRPYYEFDDIAGTHVRSNDAKELFMEGRKLDLDRLQEFLTAEELLIKEHRKAHRIEMAKQFARQREARRIERIEHGKTTQA